MFTRIVGIVLPMWLLCDARYLQIASFMLDCWYLVQDFGF